METFDVEGFPETKLMLALFKNVKNATNLKSKHLNRVALVDAGKTRLRQRAEGFSLRRRCDNMLFSACMSMNITAFSISTSSILLFARCQKGVELHVGNAYSEVNKFTVGHFRLSSMT